MMMNKQIREMSDADIDNLETLGLDDTFNFQCRACGKCCKNRNDILLTAYDVFKIAKSLGRTPEEIIERYCEVYEGHTSHFPIVRLLPVPPDNSCPFLRNKKCSVHDKKPTVCRVYPLARIYESDGRSKYYLNGSYCKHEPRPVTVREWIGDVATDESEDAGRLWRDILFTIIPHIHPDKFSDPVLKRQEVLGILVDVLWLSYDTQKSFVPQLESKIEIIKNIFRECAIIP